MKTLSIDIETFSSVNLAKCGVYKYVESRILKFFSLDIQLMVALYRLLTLLLVKQYRKKLSTYLPMKM